MNFCFVLRNKLFGSSQPGSAARIEKYLQIFRENNIKYLVSLHKKIILPEAYKKYFKTYYFPIEEFSIPDIRYFNEIVSTVAMHIEQNDAVNVNCSSGIKRTGLILTGVVMKLLNMKYKDAHAFVSEHRYAPDDKEEEKLLLRYESLIYDPNKETKTGEEMDENEDEDSVQEKNNSNKNSQNIKNEDQDDEIIDFDDDE